MIMILSEFYKIIYIDMSYVRIKSIKIKNYRSFWPIEQIINFPNENYNKPISIIWYNNCWKTNLMNILFYATQVNYVWKDSFEINDFHNRDINNIPEFCVELDSSSEIKYDGKYASLKWFHKLNIQTDWNEIEWGKLESFESLLPERQNYQSFWAWRYFPIYAINFHNIKEEISTQKTSRWNLKSFLAKHIKKIIDSDSVMIQRKNEFKDEINNATKNVLCWKWETVQQSKLQDFIERIKKNYNQNLRDNAIEIDFSLPEYEDIFLQMIFKIWLNGNKDNLVPIDHFWDWYISMFVMAVIQAIAEENTNDKALFLFEEPESFLHENHQEYFYKAVLCKLAEKWHQVIYTTHSARMVDPFNTKWIIKLEMNNENQTICTYNNSEEVINEEEIHTIDDEIITLKDYNPFIKTIEPNLNKILFSKKVILVEWPNDLLVYKEIIKQKVKKMIENNTKIEDKERYADTYLNYNNIVIIPHHWKATAIFLIKICKHFKIDYFVINDRDFEENKLSIDEVKNASQVSEISLYNTIDSNHKWMITTNFNLLKEADEWKIHFNIPKLEIVIWYNKDNKNPIWIYKKITDENFEIEDSLFPPELQDFIWLTTIHWDEEEWQIDETQPHSELPF